MADESVPVEVTADGYLRLPGEFSAKYFPHDRCIGAHKDGEYILWPSTIYADASVIMKQRNVAGDRSTLIREMWTDDYPVGHFDALWQSSRKRLVLSPENRT